MARQFSTGTKFGSEKGKIQNPARIPPQTPPAGGKKAEAGQFHSPRKIVCPAESKLVFRIFVKKCSNFVQKTPPGGVYLKKSELILRPLARRAEFPPNPLSARLTLKRKRKERFQVFLWRLNNMFFRPNICTVIHTIKCFLLAQNISRSHKSFLAFCHFFIKVSFCGV